MRLHQSAQLRYYFSEVTKRLLSSPRSIHTSPLLGRGLTIAFHRYAILEPIAITTFASSVVDKPAPVAAG